MDIHRPTEQTHGNTMIRADYHSTQGSGDLLDPILKDEPDHQGGQAIPTDDHKRAYEETV
jgi:hypothetical protein